MRVITQAASIRRGASALLAFAFFSLALAPAYASDTEVYLRPSGGESSPTVMMFLDSSDVMNRCMTDNNAGVCANVDNRRITYLRNTVQRVLEGNPDITLGKITKPAPGYVKMGYSRNNPAANDGGWVRFPATKLDDPSPMFTGRTVSIVSDSFDDSTATNTDGRFLALGSGTAAVRLRFTNLTIPRDAIVHSARIFFTQCNVSGVNCNVNNGAVPSAPAVDVRMRLNDNPALLNTVATISSSLLDVSQWGTVPAGNVVYGTTGAKSVPISASGTRGVLDITPLIDNFVKNSYQTGWDWCGGNNIALRVEPGSGSGGANNNTWNVFSFDNANTNTTAGRQMRPRLEVVYTLPDDRLTNTCSRPVLSTVLAVKDSLDDVEWMTGSTVVNTGDPGLEPALIIDGVRNNVGVRFQNVRVPQGATITEAFLYATGYCNADCPTLVANPPTAPLNIAAFAADNLPAFCTTAVNCTVPATGAGALTAAGAWNTVLQHTTTQLNHAADVRAQVAAVVARPGWTAGNALGFLINSTSATSYPKASLSSLKSNASAAMFLRITYQMPNRMTNLTGMRTARQGLRDDVEAFLYAGGGTPIGDAYGETARYMLGMTPRYDTTATTNFGGQLSTITYKIPDDSTVSTSSGTKRYVSPLGEVVDECSSGASIFAMTGGVNANASNATQNADLITSGYPNPSASQTPVFSGGNDSANFKAMSSVATHLASGKNQKASSIRTNVVLFRSSGQTTDSPLVKDLQQVAYGVYGTNGGKYFEANDESQLTAALEETLRDVIDTDGTITAPGVAVNQFNRLSHLDQLYYAVFDPPKPPSVRWRGNVKRYKLQFTDTEFASTATIVDRNGNPAVDPLTGFFAPDSHSFWSSTPDGAAVDRGGAAALLPEPANRRIFTNVDSSSPDNKLNLVLLQNMDNAKAKAAMGVSTDGALTNLVNWLRGWKIDIKDINNDVKTTAVSLTGAEFRNEMGGVLHSQPVLVNYGYISTADLQDTDPNPLTSKNPNVNADYQDNTVFFSTMEGMLHAVDAKTGIEQFAFIPRAVLGNVKPLALEAPLASFSDPPLFGMDLTWTPWREDGDGNLKIETSNSADRLWMFGGQRMGGRNYYALDVKNRTNPTLKWMIEGGLTPGFRGLGQTWSQPVLGKVKVNGALRDVVIVGGGYDMKHEASGYNPSNDPTGAWIYIVDAVTGERIWSASGMTNTADTPTMTVADLKWGIPSSIKTLDVNTDGLVDALYFGDLAGQVFRVDIDNGNTGAGTLVKRVRRLANLGFLVDATTANVTNQRRFYEAPSVAVMKAPDGSSYVAVALGSGYRSRPLNTETQDRFFMLKDTDVLRNDILTTTSLQSLITPANLADVNLSSPAGVDMAGKMGWMVTFVESGEKVMSKAIILLGEVFFTTYLPDSGEASLCSPVIGESRLWRMSAYDAAAVFDLNKDGTISALDRFVGGRKGIVGEPQPFVDGSGKNAILTGTGVERNRDLQAPGMRRTRWFEMKKK